MQKTYFLTGFSSKWTYSPQILQLVSLRSIVKKSNLKETLLTDGVFA